MKQLPTLARTMARLPDPTSLDMSDPAAVRSFLVSLTSSISTQLQQRPPAAASQVQRLFTSPNGTTFAVTVADDGTVSADPLGSTHTLPVPPT